MSRYARRKDGNQSALERDLATVPGLQLWDCSSYGGGFPDLLVGFQGRFVLFEVKDPAQPPSKRKLTDAEAEFFDAFVNHPVYVVTTFDEALARLGIVRPHV